MTQNVHKQKWDSVGRYKLNRMLKELGIITGHGTELVTVYIPPRRPIFEVIAQLRNEAGTASNIKSDLTRTHVQDALSRTIEHLKLFKETPENGLAIFCGHEPTGDSTPIGAAYATATLYFADCGPRSGLAMFRCDKPTTYCTSEIISAPFTFRHLPAPYRTP